MAKEKRPKDDLRATAKSRMAHAPAEDETSPPNERGMGQRDAGRRQMGPQDADASGGPMDLPDEPATRPDEPQMKQSMSREEKRRNQPKR